MKKFILTFALFWVSAVCASEGIPSLVELVTGTKQAAQFLGVQNDTVSLGGYIQNKFTIVKIAKKQFKRIVDEKGNDLLATSSSAWFRVLKLRLQKKASLHSAVTWL